MSTDALTLDDIRLGMAWSGRAITMTANSIIAFATEYDPQPFHVDPASAALGPFGGLIASGWQIAALAMRELVSLRPFGSSPIVGLGVDDLRWLKPVRPGDVLRVSAKIVEVRKSTTRPDRGVVRLAIAATNGSGETVMSFHASTQLMARLSSQQPHG